LIKSKKERKEVTSFEAVEKLYKIEVEDSNDINMSRIHGKVIIFIYNILLTYTSYRPGICEKAIQIQELCIIVRS
jgi:hypothetical protein